MSPRERFEQLDWSREQIAICRLPLSRPLTNDERFGLEHRLRAIVQGQSSRHTTVGMEQRPLVSVSLDGQIFMNTYVTEHQDPHGNLVVLREHPIQIKAMFDAICEAIKPYWQADRDGPLPDWEAPPALPSTLVLPRQGIRAKLARVLPFLAQAPTLQPPSEAEQDRHEHEWRQGQFQRLMHAIGQSDVVQRAVADLHERLEAENADRPISQLALPAIVGLTVPLTVNGRRAELLVRRPSLEGAPGIEFALRVLTDERVWTEYFTLPGEKAVLSGGMEGMTLRNQRPGRVMRLSVDPPAQGKVTCSPRELPSASAVTYVPEADA